ncbi:MAG TPA: gluconate 2-dehydrogenase subunit 3 family protein [Gemmatimonadaceae bacterium]
MTTRRTFLGWLSGLGAALGLGVRTRDAAAGTAATEPQQAPLNEAAIRSIAEAVLPAELGPTGVARVSRGFAQWISAYKPGVELVHPYGSAQLRQTAASPAPRWRSQLATLDRDARAKYRRGFSAISVEQRRALIREALAAERLNRLPDPLEAGHVAMALMAWYFTTPEATNLCYNARIDRQQCRPLVNVSRQPLPLVTNGGPEAGGAPR